MAHDPMRLLDAGTDPGGLEDAAREQGEDILQTTRGGRTLDLGWYRDRYRVLLVEGENWNTPVRQVEALDLVRALAAFQELLV